MVDRLPIIDGLETELETIEHEILRGAAKKSIQQLYELKQRTMVLRHAVAPLLEAVAAVRRPRAANLSGVQSLRDVLTT
jgi:magnesium transporter